MLPSCLHGKDCRRRTKRLCIITCWLLSVSGRRPKRSRIRLAIKENIAQLIRWCIVFFSGSTIPNVYFYTVKSTTSFYLSESLSFPCLSRHTWADDIRPAGSWLREKEAAKYCLFWHEGCRYSALFDWSQRRICSIVDNINQRGQVSADARTSRGQSWNQWGQHGVSLHEVNGKKIPSHNIGCKCKQLREIAHTVFKQFSETLSKQQVMDCREESVTDKQRDKQMVGALLRSRVTLHCWFKRTPISQNAVASTFF